MKRLHKHLIGAAIGVLAAGSAFAQAGPQARGEAARQPRAAVQDKLGLSPEQRAEMEKLGVAFRKEQIRARADLQVARLELRELLSAPTIDDKAVMAKAQEFSQLQAAQTKRMIEHRLAFAKILTPEQRQKARELGLHRGWQGGRGQGHAFRDRVRRHRGGWGPDALGPGGPAGGPGVGFRGDVD